MSDRESVNNFINFILESDLEFCEKYLDRLSDDERALFLEENPDIIESLRDL